MNRRNFLKSLTAISLMPIIPAATIASTLEESSGLKIIKNNKGDIYFGDNGVERLRIDSSGNLGIGTSTPENIVHVHRTIKYEHEADVFTIT